MIAPSVMQVARRAARAGLLLGLLGCGDGSAPTGGRSADIGGSLDATQLGDVAVGDAQANIFVGRGGTVATFFAGASGTRSYQLSWSAVARVFVSVRTNDAGSAPVIDLWSSAGSRTRHVMLDSLPAPIANSTPITLVPGPGTAVVLPGGRLTWTAVYQGATTAQNVVAVLDSGASTPRFIARPVLSYSTCLVRDTSSTGLLVVGPDSVAGDVARVLAIRELDAATGSYGARIGLAGTSTECTSALATSNSIYLLLDGALTRVDRLTGAQRWQLPRNASGHFALSPDGGRLAVASSATQPLAFSARVVVVDTSGRTQSDRQYGAFASPATRDLWSVAGDVAWTTDGTRLLVALTGGTLSDPQPLASVVVLDAATGAQLSRMSPVSSSLLLGLMPMR